MAKETTDMPDLERKSAIVQTGIIRKGADRIGRFIIPIEARIAMGLKPDEPLSYTVNTQKEFTIRKCGFKDGEIMALAEGFAGVLHRRLNGAPVAICDLQRILADEGLRKSIVGKGLSPEMISRIKDGSSEDGNCEIVPGTGITAAYVMPIVKSKQYGAILIPNENAILLSGVSQKAILLTLDTAAGLLADQMEEIRKAEQESLK